MISYRLGGFKVLALLFLAGDLYAEVLTGIDVLRRDDFAQLHGQRVGVISNHTGLARDGASTVDLIHEAEGIDLVRIFSPEHGFRGTEERDGISDSIDKKTGKSVVSLYGETRKPTPAHLTGLNSIVFDIQDIGCRFYTYISTMGLAMEAAAEAGVSMVILDRPNPIGGISVKGGLPDNQGSFTCFHDIPIVHGMTVGELALLMRKERKELNSLELTVIQMEGWSRGMHYDATELRWVAPSPNMPNLEAAFLYPGIGLLEFMNISVGRGTDFPFGVVGAPFLDGEKLAKEMTSLSLVGVEIQPATFTPAKSLFEGQLCSGIRIKLLDRDACSPLMIGLELASILGMGDREQLKFEALRTLLVDEETFRSIASGGSRLEASTHWEAGRALFLRRREAVLLYSP